MVELFIIFKNKIFWEILIIGIVFFIILCDKSKIINSSIWFYVKDKNVWKKLEGNII